MKAKLSIFAIALFAVLTLAFTSETVHAAGLCSRSDCPCVTVANPSNAVKACSHYVSNGKLRCKAKGHYY